MVGPSLSDYSLVFRSQEMEYLSLASSDRDYSSSHDNREDSVSCRVTVDDLNLFHLSKV